MAAIVGIYLGLSLAPLFGQQLSSGADFLTIDSGARSEGMGGAFTAVADDVNALTWNPAGLALLQHPEVGYLHMLYIGDLSYNFGGGAMSFPSGEDSIGVGAGIVNLGVPSFDSTLGLASAVSAGDNAFMASFAYRVKNIVAFGVTGKYVMRNIAGYTANAFAGDAGVLVTPDDRFRIGAGIFNVGQSVQFISAADPLPTTVRLGFSYEVLDIPHHSVRLALDNAYLFQAQGYAGAVGAEYWYDKTLAVRAGYTGDSYQQHMTAGVGVNLNLFQLDYAYAPLGTLGDTHRLSLIFRFGAEGAGELGAPLGFASKGFDGGVVLAWKPPESHDVVGYNLYLKRPGTESFARINRKVITDTTAKFKNLKNGISYTFGLAAVSAAGRESPMVELSAAPSIAQGPVATAPGLQPPTGFKALPQGEGVVLVWDKALSADAAGFNLYLADDSGKPLRKMTSQPINDTRVDLKKVNPAKTYRFLLVAVDKNGVESAPSPLLAFTLSDLRQGAAAQALASPGFPVPAAFVAEPGDGAVHLSWAPVAGAVGYNIYVSEDGVSYRLLTKGGPKAILKALLKPLHNGQTYYFAVTAVASDGAESAKAVQRVVPNPATAAQ